MVRRDASQQESLVLMADNLPQPGAAFTLPVTLSYPAVRNHRRYDVSAIRPGGQHHYRNSFDRDLDLDQHRFLDESPLGPPSTTRTTARLPQFPLSVGTQMSLPATPCHLLGAILKV